MTSAIIPLNIGAAGKKPALGRRYYLSSVPLVPSVPYQS